MIDWEEELPQIKALAEKYNVDPAFIRAIRATENGGPDIPFGVEPPGKYTYAQQLEITCRSVAHRVLGYTASHNGIFDATADCRLFYSQAFVEYFAHIWAPENVANDPTGLNANWFTNCWRFYNQFCR